MFDLARYPTLEGMARKKRYKKQHIDVEVVNLTTKERKTFKIGDERVIFDKKTGTHRVLPRKTATYDIDESKKEKK